jgi:predicted ATP-grasp superfamily ATP-dependent carboligase
MDQRLLPVVVLGIETPIGLAIVRELGTRGVAVHGIAWSAGALGLASRYLHRGLIRAKGEEALIQQLIELSANELGDACLFAIAENDITLLNRHRDRLAGYRMMFADEARMNRVINKEQTYAAASKAGLRVPQTRQIASMVQAEVASRELRFPVVLKWANPYDVTRSLSAAGLPLEKAHYCYTREELLNYLRPYEAVGVYPMVQEYCAGYGLGQFVLMKDRQAHYLFQHQRVHEWPPEGGFSSLCVSVGLDQHHKLMQQSIALLQELDWEGIAMVEYRHDPATGESALMEINGRFWGSLPLAWHAGAPFPWLTYQLFGMGKALQPPPYRAGIRCRFMAPETKRLLRVLFQPQRIADKSIRFKRLPTLMGYLIDFIRPGTRYFVFAWRDPAPFFKDIRGMGRE